MKKKIAVGLIVNLLWLAPTYAEERSGNALVNPDGGILIAGYQYVVTDANGTVIAVTSNPGLAPAGGNVWSNNGSWGNVQVGGVIRNEAQGNIYYTPGTSVPAPAPAPVVITAPVVDTKTAIVQPAIEIKQSVVQDPVPVSTSIVDTKTITIADTSTVLVDTKTVTIDYSKIDWATLDWTTFDWEDFLAWLTAYIDDLLAVKP